MHFELGLQNAILEVQRQITNVYLNPWAAYQSLSNLIILI